MSAEVQEVTKPTFNTTLHWTNIPESLAEKGKRWDLQELKTVIRIYKVWDCGGEEEKDQLLKESLKRAFLPFLALKGIFRAWLSSSASTRKTREVTRRKFLHQSLPPQKTASIWRLNSQRYPREAFIQLTHSFMERMPLILIAVFTRTCHVLFSLVDSTQSATELFRFPCVKTSQMQQ